MDFDFSDEQQQLREAVHKWVDKGYNFERRRAIVAAGGYDAGAYGELAELGLTGLCIDAQHGGLGLGPIEAMVVLEELGRGMVLEPLAVLWLAAHALQTHAPADLQNAWLPRLASGQALAVLAHIERGARHRLEPCRTQARLDGGQWSISGHKSVVPVGDRADAYIVPAMVDQKLGLWLVERQARGVQTQGYLTQDGARAAELQLDHSPAQLITLDGLQALELMADIGSASVCAQAVGLMERTLALTVEYMNTRKQFGVPIASFQALRHRVADMKMQLELSRSMSYYASLKLTAPGPQRRQAVARARYQLGGAMRFIGQSAVQLHGGIGVTDEYIVSHCFKSLTQLEMTFGDTLHHLGEVSQRMDETAGVFA
jgi:alkylation response protein AidB-like acyl-CoA dehydrogenase